MQANVATKMLLRASFSGLALALALSQTAFTDQGQPPAGRAVKGAKQAGEQGGQRPVPVNSEERPGDREESVAGAAPNQAGWLLTGNAGTMPGMNFLGTTDNTALEIRVNNERALCIEPASHSQLGFSPNLVGGFSGNSVTAGVIGATISGGGNPGFDNRVTDHFGTVSGGRKNQAGDLTTTDNIAATVCGGSANIASGDHSAVSGGSDNTASDFLSTVGGGGLNMASGFAATVAGGFNNAASGLRSTVAGGDSNTASSDHATVGGGFQNMASGLRSTVAGGFNNTASGDHATVGGGFRNTASGLRSTVVGGDGNTALGNFSLAAGRSAKANHVGAFVWADAFGTDFASTADNQFNVRASGGARIFSNTAATTGVRLAPGGNSWMGASDRNLKENFTPVDGRLILHQLSLIPITRWNLKSQDPSIWHLGPTAQDFYAAFGLGEDDRYITGSDADGIALVSIQSLYQMSLEKDRQIEELQQRIRKLEQMVEALSRK